MEEDQRHQRLATLLPLVLPAILVGVGSALTLIALSLLAGELQKALFDHLPGVFGATGDTRWWIVLVLTLAGLAVGLVVWLAPGHAGPDPATTSLVEAPLALGVLPGLALALVIGLGAGVSLGPENPIIAINTALTVAVLARFVPSIPVPTGVMLAVAATLGAMFGTPVAAALLLTEIPARKPGTELWDRLFPPLVAAGSGALTMVLFERPVLAVSVPAYGSPRIIDLVTGTGVALVGVLVALCALYAFPLVHKGFQAIGHPVLALTLGGAVLGLLGALGGQVSMFKGLDEMKELTADAADHSTGYLVAVTLIKLAALVVAASCGFRGGRIFPAVFVGVGVGLVAHSAITSIPPALAIASGVLGTMLVVARDGWLSLFMCVTTVGDIGLLPVMCVIVLPVWLFVTGRPGMVIPATAPPAREAPRPG